MMTTKENKEALLIALEKSMGVVAPACKKAGIGRTTFYKYKKQDKDFAKKVKEIEEERLDFAESCLLSGMKKGNQTLIMYYLNNKGGSRGYSREQKDFGGGNKPTINILGMDESAI